MTWPKSFPHGTAISYVQNARPTMGLLMLNQHICQEATPIYYGENIFSFRNLSAINPFLSDRTSTSLSQMGKIRVVLGSHPAQWQQELLIKTFSDMRKSELFQPKEIEVFCDELWRHPNLNGTTYMYQFRIHQQKIEWTYDLHSDTLRVPKTSESLNLVNSTLHLTADKMWASLFPAVEARRTGALSPPVARAKVGPRGLRLGPPWPTN